MFKSKNTTLIKKEARKMGAKIKDTLRERNLFNVIYRGVTITVERSFFINRSPFVGVQTTKFKDATYNILRESKISTPKAVCFYRCNTKKSEISDKLKKLKYPVIIKQLEGSNSKDIYPNVKTVNAALTLVRRELSKNCRLMAQEMVYGREFRLLVLDNRVIGALEMLPPAIYGDGEHCIEKIIKENNKTLKKPILTDEMLVKLLSQQGYKLGSIPNKGERVKVKYYSSLSSGGETVDVTDMVHGGFHRIGAEVAKATGKYLCGIDIICDDITKNPQGQKYFILEVNGRPDLTIHYSPNYGQTQNVVKTIIEFIVSHKVKFK